MTLAVWQARLEAHFADLRRERSRVVGDKPIFALEHGLDKSELQRLASDVREHVTTVPPSREHALPWVVYAAEMGYRYAGDEYWQTFEEETPGWVDHGDRYWIRDRFRGFHERFGGARPSGSWADHFSIICWPITHAILPRDLQKQLARILYQVRHSFSADVFTSPTALGELIAARSWEGTSRFQNLAQETILVGQIAAALLLEGELGTAGLLLPATLTRIGRDLDRERSARDWLRGARHFAVERARFRGLATIGTRVPGSRVPAERAREEIAALALEPRLALRPSDVARTSWNVLLEIPGLSHLLIKFPALRGTLTDSRCVVAGALGRPLARGRLMHGPQQVELCRWPRPDEVLLQFERTEPQLEYLFRTEALLRPGPTWLFRIASDGIAYELRNLRIRPGQRYLLISTAGPFAPNTIARIVTLSCQGIYGAFLDLPPALSGEGATWLHSLGLSQAKSIQVWPAGLGAARWDGEGRGEWLVTETPCIAMMADHEVDHVTATLTSVGVEELELRPAAPGSCVFLELPALPKGVHKLRVRAREGAAGGDEVIGELDLIIREPRSWAPGLSPRGPLILDVDPAAPSLEQVWEGRVDVAVRGPAGRQVSCTVNLFEKVSEPPSIGKRLPPLKLPITPVVWQAHFEKYFRKAREVQNAYDAARACDIEFRAEELGALDLRCEREFTPVRWAVRRVSQGQTIKLLDDSGASTSVVTRRFSFEAPFAEERLDAALLLRGMAVPSLGGLYVAHQGDFVAAIIVPPAVRELAELHCDPRILERIRSVAAAAEVLQCTRFWARARLSGNLLSAVRQREVLRALTRHLFFILGGEVWERSEKSLNTGRDRLAELKQAVSTRVEERGLAAALNLEHTALAGAPTEDRVKRLTSLATSFLHLQRLADPAIPLRAGLMLFQQDAEGGDESTPNWLCELALRLASDPAGACTWAGVNLVSGLTRLNERPALARAARFLVLAVDRYLESQPGAEWGLYAGWSWK